MKPRKSRKPCGNIVIPRTQFVPSRFISPGALFRSDGTSGLIRHLVHGHLIGKERRRVSRKWDSCFFFFFSPSREPKCQRRRTVCLSSSKEGGGGGEQGANQGRTHSGFGNEAISLPATLRTFTLSFPAAAQRPSLLTSPFAGNRRAR